MKDEYIIINKTILQKRIEELEIQNKELAYSDEANPYGLGAIAGKIQELKEILSQSNPLTPEIEKAFLAGRSIENIDSLNDIKPTYIQFEDYISNLKLDI